MTIQYSFLQPFICACQFLTRIPLSTNESPSDKTLGLSILYYPLVGLIIGLILAIVAFLLNNIFNNALTSVLILTLWVLITGALHIDGLADTSDAWVGGLGSKERTLEIMKDPASGPIGVSAIVLILLIKVFAIHSLLGSGASALLIVIAPVLARTAILMLFLSTPYVRQRGIGCTPIENMPKQQAKYVCFAVVLTLLMFTPMQTLSALICCAVIFLVLRQLMFKRLHGFTGDTAGAMVEILEAGALLALVASVI